MRRSTKILFVRRTVFVLLILAVHILQNTRGLFPEIFGVKANLLIPLVICIGMFEREIAGAVLGMLAGILWDSVSRMGDGYNALLLMLAGAAAGLLIDYLMRNNLMTALLLSGFACLIYSVFYVVFFLLANGVDSTGYLLIRYYIPAAVYSFLFTPLWYIIVRAVMRRTKINVLEN